MQMNWGLSIQKYETNLGLEYPVPEVKYMDWKGMELSRLHGNKDFESYNEYIEFVINHPVIFISYFKHAFNGLDITTPRAYIFKDLYHRSILLKLFNYTLLFLGILGVYFTFRKSSRLVKVFTILIFTISGLILPLAIEVRFFLPLHFILYFYGLSFLNDFILEKKVFQRKWWLVITLVYICFVSFCLYRSESLMSTLEFYNKI